MQPADVLQSTTFHIVTNAGGAAAAAGAGPAAAVAAVTALQNQPVTPCDGGTG